MSERAHTLTDEDIVELLVGAGARPNRIHPEELVAGLSSRRPKDPDAGLGAQPWRIGRSLFNAIMCGQEVVCVVYNPASAFDKDAVVRAILAAPKAIKLARAIVAGRETRTTAEALDVIRQAEIDAREVLAIADGTLDEAA